MPEEFEMTKTKGGIGKTKIIAIGIVALISVAVMLPIMTTSAVSYRKLRICSKCYSVMANSNGWTRITANLYYLNYDPDGLNLPNSYRVYQKYTRIGSGSCEDFIKGVRNYLYRPPSSWKQGPRVMTSAYISPGTVIATFRNGKYYGHVAVFVGFTSGKTGFMVFDQDWRTSGSLYGCVGKHYIYKTGSGLSDADNYYIVLVPYS